MREEAAPILFARHSTTRDFPFLKQFGPSENMKNLLHRIFNIVYTITPDFGRKLLDNSEGPSFLSESSLVKRCQFSRQERPRPTPGPTLGRLDAGTSAVAGDNGRITAIQAAGSDGGPHPNQRNVPSTCTSGGNLGKVPSRPASHKLVKPRGPCHLSLGSAWAL